MQEQFYLIQQEAKRLEPPIIALTERLKTMEAQMMKNVERANAEFSRLDGVQQEIRFAMAKKEEVNSSREEIETSLLSLEKQQQILQRELEEKFKTEQNRIQVDIQTLADRMKLQNGETGQIEAAIRRELETLSTTGKDSVSRAQEEQMKRLEKMREEISQEFKRLIAVVDDVKGESAEKRRMLRLEKEFENQIDVWKRSTDDLKKTISVQEKLLTQTRKDLKEEIDQRAKDLFSSVSSQGSALSSQQKMMAKVDQQLKELRDAIAKNNESSKRLNKLVKQFGQLKEISIPERKGMLSGLFKKKREPANIREMETDLKTSIKKLEVQKKEENLGVIAKIGLEEGLISEKDLK